MIQFDFAPWTWKKKITNSTNDFQLGRTSQRHFYPTIPSCNEWLFEKNQNPIR